MTRRATLIDLAGTLTDLNRSPVTESRFKNCIIDHTTPAAAADGATAVFIKLGVGMDVFPAAYLASYNAGTAAAGDMVRVEFAGGSPLIHGQVVGLPNLT